MLDPRYHGSMEEAQELDVKHQLVQELLDLKGPEGIGEGASGESCIKAAGENEDEPTAAAPTKKKRLSDLLQNRRAHLTSQDQAAFPQADAELTKFLQEDALDASWDPLMWWRDNQRRYPLMPNFSTAGNIATRDPALCHMSTCWYFLLGICQTKVAMAC